MRLANENSGSKKTSSGENAGPNPPGPNPKKIVEKAHTWPLEKREMLKRWSTIVLSGNFVLTNKMVDQFFDRLEQLKSPKDDEDSIWHSEAVGRLLDEVVPDSEGLSRDDTRRTILREGDDAAGGRPTYVERSV